MLLGWGFVQLLAVFEEVVEDFGVVAASLVQVSFKLFPELLALFQL